MRRRLLSAACLLVASAALSLGDLELSSPAERALESDHTRSGLSSEFTRPWFDAVPDLAWLGFGAGAILGLVILMRWHSLWLLPLAVVGFGAASEAWLLPYRVPDGMDFIAESPSSAAFLAPFLIPVLAAACAALAWIDRARSSRRDRAPRGGPSPSSVADGLVQRLAGGRQGG